MYKNIKKIKHSISDITTDLSLPIQNVWDWKELSVFNSIFFPVLIYTNHCCCKPDVEKTFP